MIALILNEESIPSLTEDDVQLDWVARLADTIVAAKKAQPELKVTRVSREWLQDFEQLLFSLKGSKKIRKTVESFLLKNLAPPFLAKEDEETHVDSYVVCRANFSDPVEVEDVESGKVAKIYGFPLLSADTPPWRICTIKGNYECDGVKEDVDWANMSEPAHVKDCHKELLAGFTPAKPPTSEIKPEEKLLDTGKHHGQDELEKVGKKLRRSPYVVAIPGSAEWDNSSSAFAHPKRIYENKGTWFIKVVLYRTKAGYSLLVQTTARNRYEAEYIATVLEKLY